ncbi:hypothetical protein SAMD00019534_024660 [Acytostelium subglobosum LB1]|uniref:hypothetical protein n=1 Tax=Acytostelium subglobosum LB1 TaxID=1410327 RepID=UPI0006450D8C|nr:hypothetical protein SAMD00019534_024660 [Acytostelium subglobosum LB1]GAM19291.1 hypothetical protein SAMD00019534_024660 [Acytostelium subglobosum LB1]|eukprot:XP_012757218.1 hypothetical protein SAMD00019534_024660 [Acytostelium subglobosum LB1]
MTLKQQQICCGGGSSRSKHHHQILAPTITTTTTCILLILLLFCNITYSKQEDSTLKTQSQTAASTSDYSLSSSSLTSSGSTAADNIDAHLRNLTNVDNTHFAFPRNITRLFKGDWNISSALPSSQVFSFDRQSGQTIFSLLNIHRYPSLTFDSVEGEMIIRDGVYSSDNSKKYLMVGIYEFELGLATLVAFPHQYGIFTAPMQLNITNATTADNAKAQMGQWMLNSTSTDECLLQVTYQFESNNTNSNVNQNEDMEEEDEHLFKVNGQYTSNLCKIDLTIDASSIIMSIYRAKWVNYVIMVSLCSFVQIFVLIKQMDNSGTQAGAAKVSLYTVGMQAIMDAYLFLLHLTGGVVFESLFNAFATAAFFQFITFSLFEMRYLLIILKANIPQTAAEGWDALRREFSLFYLKFYTIMILIIMVIYYVSSLFQVILFILFSYWVPQIWSNVYRSTRRPFIWSYVLGMSITRLSLPLYFYGCPNNFFSIKPNFAYCAIMVIWTCIQVLTLWLQDKYGPQFFVPKRFLPPKYQYTRPISNSIRNREEGQGCVICINDIEENDSEYMITPCDHLFHERCLLRWMDFKMECPTCRRPIPAP